MSQATDPASVKRSSGLAFLYWVIVAIPLVWGVANSINSSLPLFGGKSAYIPWVIGAPPKPAAAPTTTAAPLPKP